MAGHKVARDAMKNPKLFDKYECPHCHFLLKNAVQPVCGHWMCESCAIALLTLPSPKCPQPECHEDLRGDAEEGQEYFPDRFVRREINRMILYCPNRSKGCKWEDKLAKLEAHLETCDFTSEQCPQCGTILTPEQVESHKLTCPKAMVECPLAEHGCTYKQTMTREEMIQHAYDNEVEHLQVISHALNLLGPNRANGLPADYIDEGNNTAGHEFVSLNRCADIVETDGPKGLSEPQKCVRL